MKGKILVLSSLVALLSIASSSTTLSYLTDTTESRATFTTGNVTVQTLTASVDRDDANFAAMANAETYTTYLQQNCQEMAQNDQCRMYTYIKNTGRSDAYVRIRMLIPERLLDDTSPSITINRTANTEYSMSTNSSVDCDNTGAELCRELIFTRTAKLSPGSMTSNSVIDSITSLVTPSTSAEGANATATSGLDLASTIKIYTEAIQANGFSTAAQAFENFSHV